MSYSLLDSILRPWAHRRKIKLFDEFGGKEARFFYVPGLKRECFQVTIEPPNAAGILVQAWSIETEDDVELHHAWFVGLDNFAGAMEMALAKIDEWKVRPQGKATW